MCLSARHILLCLCVVPVTTCRVDAAANHAMVATVHPLATDAGLSALRRGGNAIDAAVAAALTLGVVDGHNSGIGGGCLILIRRFDGKLLAIDGRETAPAKANSRMYLCHGKPQPELSTTGPLASGTPGALAAYADAVGHYGRLHLEDLLLPAAKIAEQGFPISGAYAEALKKEAEHLAKYPGSRAVLLKADGLPYEEGEILRQPDLARTYRAIAAQGTDWFYRGPFARRVGAWMAENGGVLAVDDFAGYRPRRRRPIQSTYRGYTVVGFPPPSSGGVHVAQILNILERFDLRTLHGESPARFYHVVAEAMKLAFADRAHWLGDSEFADVPRGLIDKQYAATLAARIDTDKTTEVPGHGQPPRREHDLFGRQTDRHTTHIAAVDAAGNWVAVTATINTSFGSKVIVPDTGVILNNEMDDFAIAHETPNAFGLVGAEANSVAAGKRPLSSMSPTIVLKDGQPILTLGAAGGPTIISQVVLVIINHLDLGKDLPAAVAAPRIHHQWMPDELRLEPSFDQTVRDQLQKLGHQIDAKEPIGVTQAIGIRPDATTLIGVADPRTGGKAKDP